MKDKKNEIVKGVRDGYLDFYTMKDRKRKVRTLKVRNSAAVCMIASRLIWFSRPLTSFAALAGRHKRQRRDTCPRVKGNIKECG